jgi:hypothetical protein
MSTFSEDQKKTIRMIEEEAKKYGLDPDLAVAIASMESKFQHIPAGDKKSTAFGPFQVNRATAIANGFNYEDMKKDPKLAIEAGIKNLVRHITNDKLKTLNPATGQYEVDPSRVVAAHRYGENSDYATTGDPSKIDKVLGSYIADVMEHFPNEQFPQSVYTEPSSNQQASTAQNGQDTSMGRVPLGTEAPAAPAAASDMGSVPLEGSNLDGYLQNIKNKEDQRDRTELAVELGGAGAALGAVKAPAFSLGKRIYDIAKTVKNGNVTSQDLMDVAEASNKIPRSTANSNSLIPSEAQHTRAFEGTTKEQGVTGRASQTTYQLRTEQIAEQKKEQARIIAELQRKGLLPKTPPSLPGIVAATPAGIIAPTEAVESMPTDASRSSKLSQDYDDYLRTLGGQAKNLPPETGFFPKLKNVAGTVSNYAGSVLNSSPVRFGLAGLGVGQNIANADQQFGTSKIGNVAGTASALGAGASALSVIPKLTSVANPVAMGLTTAGQALGDVNRGDYNSATGNAYIGALATLMAKNPALAAALIPTNLNKGEDEELARYRSMPPRIDR